MIWVVLWLVFMIWFIWYLYDDCFTIMGAIVMWVIVGFLGLVLVSIFVSVGSMLVSDSEQVYVKENTEEIIALNDSSITNGRIGFLGSGYVDESLYYYYMTDTEYGYTASKIEADHTYVRYSDKPTIETYKSVNFKNKFYWLISFPMNTYYIAYIPEGSIIQNYQIDLD